MARRQVWQVQALSPGAPQRTYYSSRPWVGRGDIAGKRDLDAVRWRFFRRVLRVLGVSQTSAMVSDWTSKYVRLEMPLCRVGWLA